MSLLVAVDACPNCGTEEAKLLDHDSCLERFLDNEGDQAKYDPAVDCDHWKCAECELPLY